MRKTRNRDSYFLKKLQLPTIIILMIIIIIIVIVTERMWSRIWSENPRCKGGGGGSADLHIRQSPVRHYVLRRCVLTPAPPLSPLSLIILHTIKNNFISEAASAAAVPLCALASRTLNRLVLPPPPPPTRKNLFSWFKPQKRAAC